MIALGYEPSGPPTKAQVDAAFRTGTVVAIVVTLVGAVVLLISLARRTLGLRTFGRVLLILDGAVAAGMLFASSFACEVATSGRALAADTRAAPKT
jgi:hypothetical protein